MQLRYHTITIEDLMPEEHLLRKLEAALDLSFVYEETSQLYSRRYGRPPIDPVMLVKYLLVGYLYGIPSERQIEQRIQTDIALRWYLGLDLFDRVPDHSTISQLRRRKPTFRKVFRRLFEEVVRQCVERGLVSGKLAVTDSTHVKANASNRTAYLEEVREEASSYWERLDAYERDGAEELEKLTGKRRKKRETHVRKEKVKKKRISKTDPESGFISRAGKPEGFGYLCHQTSDTDHGIIIGLDVTPGDVHDSRPYLEQIEYVHRNVVPIQSAAADSAYDFPLAHRALEDLGIEFFVRFQPAEDRTEVEFKRDVFHYDEEKDVYICPNEKELCKKGITRTTGGLFWEYQADRKDCSSCPYKHKYLTEKNQNGVRKLSDSYFKPSVQRSMSRIDTEQYREALRKRQVWCEGSFAAQKWGHNLQRVLRRGLEAAEDHCLLSAAALNIKRLIRCCE